MSDNRQSLADLASLTNQPAPAAPAAPQAAPAPTALQAAPPNPNAGTAPYSGAPEAVDLGNLEHYRTHRAELRKTKLF